MNITREDTGTLSASLSIEITPDDYLDIYNNKLKEYRRKANVPGFRPGMAPMPLIKRTYGKALLVDEIEKLLHDSLENYLKENQIKTLGTPMANEEKPPLADWDNPTSFTFHFDIGIQPAFEIDLDKAGEITYYTIVPDDAELEKEIGNIRRSFGNFQPTEVSETDDWLNVELKELDETGNPAEGGITHTRRITAATFTDPGMGEKLNGLRTGDTLVFNPAAAMEGDASRTGYLLNIDKDKAAAVTADFRMTVQNVERMVLADLNTELYEKVFPGKNIDNADDFIKELRDDISRGYSREADTTFFGEVRKNILQTTPFDLPEAFLKRWMKDRKEEQEQEQEHGHGHEHEHGTEEPDYPKVFESMRWQLIENRLIETYDIRVEPEEVQTYIKERYRNYFGRQGMLYGEDGQVEQMLDTMARKYMEKEEDVREVYDVLYYHRLLGLFHEKMNKKPVEITHAAFHDLHGGHH